MILITGATGLVGAHLALQLAEKGLEFLAIYRNQNSIQKVKDLFIMYDKQKLFANITWIQADITDIPSLEIAFDNIDSVYHCAGKISFKPSDEKQLRKINIDGTANIVNICLVKNIKKICFVSSIEALGNLSANKLSDTNNSDAHIIDEETEWNPEIANTDYGISKYGAEMEIWRGQQEGLQVIIVNPGIILGALPKSWNRNEGSFRLITKVVNGLNYYTQGTTGFVGVSDVVSCMIRLMNSPEVGNRYVLVSENLSFKEITTLIAHKLQVRPPKKELQRWMSELSCNWNWIKANLLFQKSTFIKANVEWLHSKDVYSNQKIKTKLNFTFEPLETVIEKIAEKY